jgi:hypothetical protein
MPENLFFIMLLATPCDFSSRWKWKTGDRAILLGDGREILIINVRDETVECPDLTVSYLFPFADDLVVDEASASDLVPIPTVCQLQRMSGYSWRSFDEMCVYEHHILRQCEKGDITKEMIALAVYMRIKYKKEWFGGTWLRIERDEGDTDV